MEIVILQSYHYVNSENKIFQMVNEYANKTVIASTSFSIKYYGRSQQDFQWV